MFKFGIPKVEKEVTVEKFPETPVVTMLPKPAKKGGAYKFSLNEKALELLEIDLKEGASVSFSFADEDLLFAVTTGNSVPQAKVTKKGEFSDSRCHQYITKKYKHTEGDFKLTYHADDSGVVIYRLELVKEDVDTSEEVSDTSERFQVIEKSGVAVLEDKVFA